MRGYQVYSPAAAILFFAAFFMWSVSGIWGLIAVCVVSYFFLKLVNRMEACDRGLPFPPAREWPKKHPGGPGRKPKRKR